ncbi:AraC family transcriptional regulator [Rhizobiaceae bacterium n13]|uniref:AraC family transcriptional regulator n=1 Tax=Ferirhizobium litorale TaxID=2927786 RepID=A0AAE3QBU5_9HYPH|nr:AraC family transcriptional regulator [Fererhizobium litorale]MDI7860331.1 AraC family transcriptional regulator [Fererhizobium litorale]MDI7920466.1 AraC family transcriptional regulator [Fererhizobium litorale]
MSNAETSSSVLATADAANIFGPAYGFERDESAMAIVIAAERLPARRVRKVAALADWQKNKAIRYIDENVERCIKVEDVAALVKLSASRFSKAFKVSFGRSPYDYVLGRRIDAAKYLIAFTEEPLSQVAHACGLSDQAHLSKVFKRLVGVTPHKYRRFGSRSHTNAHVSWQRLAETTAAYQPV